MTEQQKNLIAKYFDGDAAGFAPAELAELEQVLEGSTEARQYYRLMATIDEGLSQREATPAFMREADVSTSAARQISLLPKLLPWAIAALAVVWAGWQMLDRDPSAVVVDIPGETAGSEFVALSVNTAGAKYASGMGPDEVRFSPGSYELEEGAVHLRFANGTDFVVQSPASFTIQDDMNVKLSGGLVRAIVPPSGQGFTIRSPGIDYEDLGTEFGLVVEPESGDSELHVFTGQVDAIDPASQQVRSSVYEGQSIGYSSGELSAVEQRSGDDFPTPGSIGYSNWHQFTQEIEQQAGLIGHYRFERDSELPKVLRNSAASPVVSDGKIVGARWVRGRWCGKWGLLFDRDSDYVEIDMPGKYKALSFSAWIKVDRYDYSINAIFDSNGWERGAVHWQIGRTGQLWLGLHEQTDLRTHPRPVVPTGEWVHVATTVEMGGESTCYVNGHSLGAGFFDSSAYMRPGLCRIGNWLADPEWGQVLKRGFRGRIDEFSIWDRSLSAEEIRRLVESGRPSTLWIANQSN